MFECTAVFNAITNSSSKVIILQGGTSSSKTISALQDDILYAVYNKGKVITVTGESIPNLKKGAYRDTEWLYSISKPFRDAVRFWNKSDRIIYLKNESVIEFISNQDEQAAKAGKRDRLFADEANGISWSVFFQMAIRTRDKIKIAYNPSAPFWAHEKLIGTTPETNDLSATVELIISDHRHNCFLSSDEHRKIEGIKDRDLWLVYARGKTGNLQGLIFPNWRSIPDKDFPWDHDAIIGGVDFGYTNDPTAAVRIARVGDNIYIHELCYETGIPPKNLCQIMKTAGFTGNTPLYCEHDGDMIKQLKLTGQLRPIAARKGAGSINAGIMKLKEYNVFYTESSTNLDTERKKYMWMIDKDTGKPINTPQPGNDHLLDAVRYAVYTHFYRQA